MCLYLVKMALNAITKAVHRNNVFNLGLETGSSRTNSLLSYGLLRITMTEKIK